VAGEGINVRGACSGCGAPLASDQRYCVECGQRVGPPLALPYLVPATAGDAAPAGRGWLASLPMPVQMVGAFAALALGFGSVIGTAISPNLAGIIAAPGPNVVTEEPPTEPPATTGGGGGGTGGGGGAAAAPATVASTTSISSGGGSGGGGGGGGGHKDTKKREEKEAPPIFTGTVVRVNPIAQSYTLSTGALVAIHADSLPDVGQRLEVPFRLLANGTYAENGTRNAIGTADAATFSGTVTYCADLERPSAPCDGSSPADHYVYSVSGVGASVLVSAPDPASAAPPMVGSMVDVSVHIGNPFQPIDPVSPDDWASDPDCTPPYDEQQGLPAERVVAAELDQTAVSVTGQASGATAEAVLQTACPGAPAGLVVSADDIRAADRDLPELAVPDGIDPARLTPGQAVQVDVAIGSDGTLSLRGITSDQGVAGADDPSQGQGTLTGT
jgi:hypothetical protein